MPELGAIVTHSVAHYHGIASSQTYPDRDPFRQPVLFIPSTPCGKLAVRRKRPSMMANRP